MTEGFYFKGELQMDHEPSLDRCAVELAKEDIEQGEEKNFDYLYECNWNWLEEMLRLDGFTIEKGR